MLSEFEKDVLRASDGEDVPGLVWGAAMGEALEYLCGQGYMERHYGPDSVDYRITEAGCKALKE